jgi:hypothetical protein
MVNGILTKKAAKKKGRQEARSVAREPVLISTVTAIPATLGQELPLHGDKVWTRARRRLKQVFRIITVAQRRAQSLWPSRT